MPIARALGVGAAVGAAVVGAALGVEARVHVVSRGPTPMDRAPALAEWQVRDLDIAFYQARVARDPQGAIDRARLAGLFLQRARETGSNEDLVRAEATARSSLDNRRARNSTALAVLANALLGQHRYVEALDAATELAAAEPDAPSARALLGEIQLELGRYDEARVTFDGLKGLARNPAIGTRLARWLELQGRTEAAHALLVATRDRALQLHELPAEQRAWYRLRVGDIALRHGRLAEAKHELDAALAAQPDDYRVLGLLARLAAVQRDWRGAVRYGERALARTLDPATLGLIGDAYAALGDSAKAEDYFRVMELSVLRQPGPFHRAWSLFLLDHDRRVPEVLAKAREEITVRRDVYGWDLLGWALHKSGRDDEAAAALQHALALGTEDAMLHYHAGVIAHAQGRSEDARRELRTALAINPAWHPTQPDDARRLLEAP